MSPHTLFPRLNDRRLKFRLALGSMVALLYLSSLLPSMAFAQTLLPVVIKLPPSFLQEAPATSMHGVVKEIAQASDPIARIAALRNSEVRAMELNAMLPHQYDHHYFGLEASERGGAFALTMVVEPTSSFDQATVNFVVLTEEGMRKVSAGADPLAVKTVMGSPLLFDQLGNRLTALVPGTMDTRYTVIVFNNSKLPVTYSLRVEGGVLVDDAGQSFSAIKVGAPIVVAANDAPTQAPSGLLPVNASVDAAGTMAKFDGVVKRMNLAGTEQERSFLANLLPEQVRARQVSGELVNAQERHYLNLATDLGGGEIVLTLRYASKGGTPTFINFWVMTQDGVRHLVQGGMAQELNLATGLPVPGQPGVYQARLRMAENMLYTVVVYSEGMTEADYTLAVQGGILVDRYGQTREAQAAEMEALALESN